jgi:hypothetical protein
MIDNANGFGKMTFAIKQIQYGVFYILPATAWNVHQYPPIAIKNFGMQGIVFADTEGLGIG